VTINQSTKERLHCWGRRWSYLAVDGGGDGEIPGGVGGHAEAEEGPDAVVVEGGDEDGGGAARPEYVRPCPLVQPVVDVVDVTANMRVVSADDDVSPTDSICNS
jgi:hypothetical protein